MAVTDLKDEKLRKRALSDYADELPVYAMRCMKTFNFYIFLFISLLMCVSTYGIIHQGSAGEFLDRLSAVPEAPWKIPLLTVGSYIILMLLMSRKKESMTAILVYTTAELTVCILMSYLINFAYSGALLLCGAEVVRYIKKTKYINYFMIIWFIAYVLADHILLAGWLNLNSYDTYLSYYSIYAGGILSGVLNVSIGINTLIFICYMIFIMRGQLLENNRMQQLNDELNKVNAELNIVNKQLSSANIQLEENAKTIAEMTQIEERNRLAREIHDTLGHALTGIVTGIDACIELILIAPDAVKKQLEVIADVARQGMTDVRRSVKALRPDALEKMQLDDAISNMIEHIVLSTPVHISYNCEVDLKSFSGDEEEVIYRIVQEGITNAMRHGKASMIDVSIKKDNSIMMIKITDNGIGCKDITSGFGLCHMRERLEMLNGTLECDGSDGFKLTARLPVRWE